MAQSHQAGDSTVTAENPITEILATPIGPDWTIEALAEQLLCRIASKPKEEAREFFLRRNGYRSTIAADSSTVARLSSDQVGCRAGTTPNIYGGHLVFKRNGPEGLVWIRGEFQNKPGNVCLAFQKPSAPYEITNPSTSEEPISRTTTPEILSSSSTAPTQEA